MGGRRSGNCNSKAKCETECSDFFHPFSPSTVTGSFK
jgi:hypothetical protein